MPAAPQVSIGLPVYNGETFVEEAIGSLLAQQDVALELLIGDNASTDATEEIVREAIRGDDRARVLRSSSNRGAAWNYNRLVEAANGTYFKWAAHDDLCAPTFVARCLEVMEADPGVSLCYPRAVDIDSDGRVVHEHPSMAYADGPRPSARAREVLRFRSPCLESFGLTRREQLLRTAMIGPYTSSDRTLFFELALQGRFHEVPEVLFLHRQHADRSVHKYRDPRDRDAWFDPARRDQFTLPHWRFVGEHVRAAAMAPGLQTPERASVLGTAIVWAARGGPALARDLGVWGRHRLRAVIASTQPS